MLEKALSGGRRFWTWIAVLSAVICAGLALWMAQLTLGLAITGLGRDVSWGLYIAQFTFLVGVAASAVMVVLPYYLHDYRAFGPLVILGEFIAIAAVVTSALFVLVDMGQPARALNVLLHPAPSSMMFWDMVSLGGYLLLNVVITRATLEAERSDVPPPAWLRAVIILSIPWAVSIHTVTALLYSGLPGRSFWLTAVMAPRFLASAFAAGPALLVLACLAARRVARFDVGRQAIARLGLVITYAMAVHVFLLLLEGFTATYAALVATATVIYAWLLGRWVWPLLGAAMVCWVLGVPVWLWMALVAAGSAGALVRPGGPRNVRRLFV